MPGGLFYLTLISSFAPPEYALEWIETYNPMLFADCHEEELKDPFLQVGYTDIEYIYIKSKLYDNVPRLGERDVKSTMSKHAGINNQQPVRLSYWF